MPLDDIKQARLEKLAKLKNAGIDPYPAQTARTHTITDAVAEFDGLAAKQSELTLVGRIMAIREHGGSTFVDINDDSAPVQIFLKRDGLGDEQFDLFAATADIGDFAEFTGTLFKTKQGEKTLAAKRWRMLAKTLLPLPEKWHGLQDVEERYRKRYLDLLLNPAVREKFAVRARVIQTLRQWLDSHGFLEVETPVLQTVAGGANARPFQTKLNALDLPVYLRVAPELFLKRLLVAGFERVYEIGKNYRNEGIDHDHNPEFSELEFYAAYRDYEWLMQCTEELLAAVVSQVYAQTKTKYKQHEIDWQGPYRRIKFNDLLKECSGLDYDQTDERALAAKAKELDIQIDKAMTKGNLADEIYKKVARPNIIQPTFVTNHPLDISPLSKEIPDHPEHVQRFQLLVAGNEIINAFSELNDPQDQRERFQTQQQAAKQGNAEAHPFDEDFVEALEYGMPPAAGWGLGIDRLVAILTDSHSIREVILFPLMRPK